MQGSKTINNRQDLKLQQNLTALSKTRFCQTKNIPLYLHPDFSYYKTKETKQGERE
jgi:hypothetical protein